MNANIKFDITRLPSVTRVVVAPSDTTGIALLMLECVDPSGQELAGHTPLRFPFGIQTSQLHDLRAKIDLAIAAIESHDAPKH